MLRSRSDLLILMCGIFCAVQVVISVFMLLVILMLHRHGQSMADFIADELEGEARAVLDQHAAESAGEPN